ncbi:MAG: hypothetical protein N2110_02965 [Flavobacteriales bacterium]|nr:hypothetical protein [Flavobacteriales bacterium]
MRNERDVPLVTGSARRHPGVVLLRAPHPSPRVRPAPGRGPPRFLPPVNILLPLCPANMLSVIHPGNSVYPSFQSLGVVYVLIEMLRGSRAK